MELDLGIGAFLLGVVLVIGSAEKLVQGLVGLLTVTGSINRLGGIALLVLYSAFVAVVVLTGGAA